MTNKNILKQVTAIQKALSGLQDKLDILLAGVREEEVMRSFQKGETVTVEQIQKKFNMGYASASHLLENLKKKGSVRKEHPR